MRICVPPSAMVSSIFLSISSKRDDVGIVVFFGAIKRAELAIDIADIGVIDVAIDDVGDDLVAAAIVQIFSQAVTPPVGQRAQFLQRQMIKPQRLGSVDTPAVPDFLHQFINAALSVTAKT